MREQLTWIVQEMWPFLTLTAAAAFVTLFVVPYFEFLYQEEKDDE